MSSPAPPSSPVSAASSAQAASLSLNPRRGRRRAAAASCPLACSLPMVAAHAAAPAADQPARRPPPLQHWAPMGSGSAPRRWWSGCCAPTSSPTSAPTPPSSPVRSRGAQRGAAPLVLLAVGAGWGPHFPVPCRHLFETSGHERPCANKPRPRAAPALVCSPGQRQAVGPRPGHCQAHAAARLRRRPGAQRLYLLW